MFSSVGRLCAGGFLAGALATCASVAWAGQGGQHLHGGSGGRSLVRVGPGALLKDPAPSPSAPHEPTSLRDALFGSRFGGARPMLGPPTGRYEVEFGRGFVFDRAGREGALLKFDDSSEILALTATPGPRGDVIFKDDVGDPILRATRIGGVTLFTPDRPEGAAAAQMGAAPTLRPPASIGPQALIRALAQASARASRAAQHLVEFDAPEVTPASDWVFADAAALTSEAFLRVLQKAPSGRALLARFFQVRLASGDAPDVVSQGAVLRITVAPDRGAAGRPSSQRIFLVLTGR